MLYSVLSDLLHRSHSTTVTQAVTLTGAVAMTGASLYFYVPAIPEELIHWFGYILMRITNVQLVVSVILFAIIWVIIWLRGRNHARSKKDLEP